LTIFFFVFGPAVGRSWHESFVAPQEANFFSRVVASEDIHQQEAAHEEAVIYTRLMLLNLFYLRSPPIVRRNSPATLGHVRATATKFI
jgi:hypothetical protein